MAIRIYIVDDEQMAIQYFSFLLKKTTVSYEMVGSSTSSRRAMEEILQLKPDIVFVDISMPVMDGLELAEQLRSRTPQKIVFLTSYRDFDYVKKGMQLGVEDYLLKNELSEKVLEELLLRVENNLAAERKKQQLILEHNVRSFLQNTGRKTEDRFYADRPLQRYALIEVCLPYIYSIEHQPQRERFAEEDSYEIGKLEYPEGLTCQAAVHMENGCICAMFFIGESVTDGQALLTEAGKRILRLMVEAGKRVQCLASETKHHFQDLQETYTELQNMSDYLYAYPDQAIVKIKDLKKINRKRIQTDALIEKIDSNVEEQKPEEAWEALQDLFLQSRNHLNVWEYTEAVQNVYRYLKMYVHRKNIRKEVLEIAEYYRTMDSMETALCECLGLLFEESGQKITASYSASVQQAIDFIHRNYSRDIAVSEIAQAANVSEGHLRRLFKQELDTRIIDYLMDYRIRCAKLLMRHGENTLTQVWQRTGFTSAQYFSYVFKHRVGILPKDYMRGETKEK